MDSSTSNPIQPSMRVLTRPPASVSAPRSASTPDTAQSSSSQSQTQSNPRSLEGLVVVGFISRSPDHCSQLLNRVLDSNTFGSGNADKSLSVGKEELIDWFKWRRISYYHDEEKGILYLQFCSTRCPALRCSSDLGSGLDSVLEEREFEDLQGLLFMFSVCHVIIYIQEGSRFNPHILKKFRVLQAAKHALAPFVRSKNTPPLPTKPQSSASSRPSLSTSSPPRRSGGVMSRSASAISLMSGSGSFTSLFPGNCTPVILFGFVDDFFDVPNPIANTEEAKDASSLNQSASLSSVCRPNLPSKGSGSVVVLARPAGKSEGGFRKKLQSSLEAQIRFLIKKCRTLSGSESGHVGSRSANSPNSPPLFSLDASRAVVLLDRFVNQRGEALEFVTDLVEDIFNGKATSDSLLLENHSQSVNKEDVLSVKEFIYRQSDILRGRGGLVPSTNSSPAAGVGMVAVAAAAAAASAASGKTFSSVELPNLEIWLSSSKHILQGILSAKRGCLEDIEAGKRKTRLRLHADGIPPRGMDPLDAAVSLLESGRGINLKFSNLWCERVLPTAKDVYLKDLPDFYPTSQHEVHLQKALSAFHSMVRGPIVPLFMKKLEDECTSIWKSGRQLCDAVSLTGKPCMHQRHDIFTGETESVAVKSHSSGYYFLHACACGRSRRLRSDPFDFESANVTFNFFEDCDKLLPALQLPEQNNVGPVQSSSWSLVRIGGAQYYKPSKGLLQSGFSVSEKFLFKWTIILEKTVKSSASTAKSLQHGSATPQGVDINVEIDRKKTDATQLNSGDIQVGIDDQKLLSVNSKASDKKIGFGRGVPAPHFTMRKPFSEVVAGSSSIDSGFPPLQQKKQPSSGSERGVKQNSARDNNSEQVVTTINEGSQKPEDIVPVKSSFIDDPSVEIGSNVVPMNIKDHQLVKLNPILKHTIVYIGFEHECPLGHRFILNTDHINELGSPYSSVEDYRGTHVETSDRSPIDPSNLGKNGVHHKIHRNSKGTAVVTANKARNADKIKHVGKNGVLSFDGVRQFSRSGKEQNQMSVGDPINQDSVKNLEADLSSVSLDDGGSAFSMLNRNLPIYMNCPHCRNSKSKKDLQKINYAGNISQLQRIIVVTPPFPIILATCPVVQFEESCLPPSVGDHEEKLQFSLGCRVVLPPESFVTLRLPFVYGVQLEDGSSSPLSAFENRPEMTAWLMKGTALQIISKESSLNERVL